MIIYTTFPKIMEVLQFKFDFFNKTNSIYKAKC